MQTPLSQVTWFIGVHKYGKTGRHKRPTVGTLKTEAAK